MEHVLTQEKTHIIGKPVIRPDALEKAIGRSRYVGDLTRPGMLHAVTVRAPHASMKSVHVDTEIASKMPRVVCIATASDIPGANHVPLVFKDQPFLANGEVRFHAEAVALVAAETYLDAVRAAEAVRVEGTIETPCIDPLEALKPSAPRIHSEDNIFKSYDIERGEVDRLMASADIVVEQTYRTPHQVHCYLEPQGMLAECDDAGGIRVEGSMQCPFYVQDAVADLLGLPKNKVIIVQSTTGGAFGGKEDVPSIVAGHAALLAWLTKRPVRLIYSREEDFRSMSKRHPSVTRVRISSTSDGKLLAADILYTLNGGAYSTLSPIVLWRGTVHAAGPYCWDAVRIHGRAVATHTVPCGAFRGFGQPQVAFAIESAMDELAKKLDISPLELRRRNIIKQGAVTATNHRIDSVCGLEEAMERAAAAIDWASKWKPAPDTIPAATHAPVRGLGISTTFYGVGLGAGGKHLARAGAYIQIEDDGSIRVYIGNTEMGQGARGAIGQIVAEGLAAPFESVYVGPTDTSRVPDSGPTVASRTTVMSGNAVLDACGTLRISLDRAAADLLECSPDQISAGNGWYLVQGQDWRAVSYAETVRQARALRLPLAATGWYVAPDTTFGDFGQGHPYMTYVWSANAVEVEVDPATLAVRLVRIAAAHDVGKAINPREVEGQIRGGVLQGIGYGIMEEIAIAPNGVMLNPGFSGYLIPTSTDTPDIIPIIVENPFPEGPFGARGIGEPPLIGVAPAIANAIANALGVRVRDLPLRPETLYACIRSMEVQS